MPSATPGRRQPLVFALLPLLPASIGKDSAHPNISFGANYRIQRLTLHLATSSQLRFHPPTLGVEFPTLTLSVVRRVPSYSIVSRLHFDENTGRLTNPCPGGPFTRLAADHFQVPGYSLPALRAWAFPKRRFATETRLASSTFDLSGIEHLHSSPFCFFSRSVI